MPQSEAETVFVANTTFCVTYEGADVFVRKDQTRVRGDHPIRMNAPALFDAVDESELLASGRAGGVEQATAEPGEKRGEPAPALASLTKEELLERARELDVEGRSGMDKDELVKAVAKAEKDR